MKKLIGFIVASTLTINSVFAAGYAPDNSSMYFSITPSALQGQLKESFFSTLESFTAMGSQYEEEQTTLSAIDLLEQTIKEETWGLSIQSLPMDYYQDPSMVFTVGMSKKDFDDIFMATILLEEQIEEKNSQEKNYYYSDDIYFAHQDETLFVSNNETNLLKTLTGETLELPEQIDQNSLLYGHFKLEKFFQDLYSQTPELETLLDMPSLKFIKTETASVNQTENGFVLNGYYELDPQYMSMPSKVNGQYKTSLYQYLPAERVILFANSLTALESKYWLPEMALAEINQELFSDSELTVEQLFALVGKEAAFVIQDSSDLYPGFTLITKPNSLQDAKLLWQKLSTELEETVSVNTKLINGGDTYYDEYAGVSYTFEDVELDGAKLQQITIEMDQQESMNPYAAKYNKPHRTFQITHGITTDKLLLFSTNKNILNEYGQSYDMGEDYNMYLDFEKLQTYFMRALSIIEEANEKIELDLSEEKAVVKELMSPFQSITQTNQYSSDKTSMSLEMQINMDIEKMYANYMNLIMTMEQLDTEEKLENAFYNSSKEFTDVKQEDWYADDVYYLAANGVVYGKYSDSGMIYDPSENLNRAEAVKLIVETLDKNNQLDSFYKWGSYYGDLSDVDSYGWYSAHLQKAEDLNLVSGYPDLTFRADNNITRAEFASIMAKIINKYEVAIPSHSLRVTFTDVEPNAWYANDISTVASYALMNGNPDGTFQPNQPLNRAEAAKVIRDLFSRF